MAAKRPNRSWNSEELERAKAMYLGGANATAIAKNLGRTIGSVNNKLSDLGIRGQSSRGISEAPTEQMVDTETKDGKEIVWTTSTPVRTQEDALRKAEVDTAVWEVERFVVNSWEVAGKDDSGEFVKTPLWQVKLWLKKRMGWSPDELRERLIESLKAEVPRPKSRAVKTPTGGLLYEISIMDHHFGKLAWAPEVGTNYDVAIAERLYMTAARELLEHARTMKPDLILLVVGNDFYHVDNGNNTTTKGTPQHADGRWQKAYVAGAKCVRAVIDEAKEIAPVRVMIVPGNHDQERAYTLGVALGMLYELDGRVTVDNEPTKWKAFAWGSTLLVFMHGDNMSADRLKRLPHEVQDRYPDLYAAAKWREIHSGHIHCENESVWFYRTSQSSGLTIHRIISSLCGTDSWHDSMGYRSLGAAEAHMYDSKRGRVGYWVSTNMAA